MTNRSYLKNMLRCIEAWLGTAERYCGDERTLGNVLEHIKAAQRQVHAAEEAEVSDFEGPTREEAKVREYYTLVDRDVGKNWLLAFEQTWLVSDFMGRILPTDVGKRVYQQGDVLQIESNNQRSRRFGIWPWCECMDTLCRATIADTGHHPASGRPPAVGCGQPAVMRLFQVTMLQVTIMVHRTLLVEGKPIAFCEPCGDNALQSGAFATSEDTAAALRAEEVHYITHGYPPEEGQ